MGALGPGSTSGFVPTVQWASHWDKACIQQGPLKDDQGFHRVMHRNMWAHGQLI
jgi:hypothetical protein